MIKNRVPKKYIPVIQDIVVKLMKSGYNDGVPRYMLAKELTKEIENLSLKTALDYIQASDREKILEKIGMNYSFRC